MGCLIPLYLNNLDTISLVERNVWVGFVKFHIAIYKFIDTKFATKLVGLEHHIICKVVVPHDLVPPREFIDQYTYSRFCLTKTKHKIANPMNFAAHEEYKINTHLLMIAHGLCLAKPHTQCHKPQKLQMKKNNSKHHVEDMYTRSKIHKPFWIYIFFDKIVCKYMNNHNFAPILPMACWTTMGSSQ